MKSKTQRISLIILIIAILSTVLNVWTLAKSFSYIEVIACVFSSIAAVSSMIVLHRK